MYKLSLFLGGLLLIFTGCSELGIPGLEDLLGRGSGESASWPPDEEDWRHITPTEVRALLANGADVHTQDDIGRTPLHWAARNNENPEVIEILLDTGAEVNTQDDIGRTPLHVAAKENKNQAVIYALLDARADLNAKDNDGWTPLDMARIYENWEVHQILLDTGATQDH